jgi:hypothetical protein
MLDVITGFADFIGGTASQQFVEQGRLNNRLAFFRSDLSVLS